MSNYSGYNDKFNTPINIGDDVLYKEYVHTVKENSQGKLIFESLLGIGDLKLLHSEVVVLKKNINH